MNIQRYWAEVRILAGELDPDAARMDLNEIDPALRGKHIERSQKEIWLTSLAGEDDPMRRAGVVVKALPYAAAQWIKNKTHRLAEGKEVEAWHDEQKRRRAEHDRGEMERRNQSATKISIDPQAIIDAVTTGLTRREG